MRNEYEDLEQQAKEIAKQEAKKAIEQAMKDALKEAGRELLAFIAPALPYIAVAVLIILVIFGCLSAAKIKASATEVVTDSTGSLSLTTTIFDKATFIKALQEYYDSNPNENFRNNFLNKAEELYDESVANNVNPEVVVITAKCEGNFAEAGGSYNYWGINVINGSNVGSSYASFADGIKGYAQTLAEYQYGGSHEELILQRYEDRKNSGCALEGYGLPGTFSGMQSVYSDLGYHVEGSSGTGGYYYMDPARAGVTQIYSTHEEFVTKCLNVDGEHAEGAICTHYERGQYTAWQVKKKIEVWNAIFGAYGSISSTETKHEGDRITTGGYTFPHYIQEDIAGNYRPIYNITIWVWSNKFSNDISRIK